LVTAGKKHAACRAGNGDRERMRMLQQSNDLEKMEIEAAIDDRQARKQCLPGIQARSTRLLHDAPMLWLMIQVGQIAPQTHSTFHDRAVVALTYAVRQIGQPVRLASANDNLIDEHCRFQFQRDGND
jgi:hypothetical protein